MLNKFEEVTTLRVVWIEIGCTGAVQTQRLVTTLRVVWIEIEEERDVMVAEFVTTLRVVWIEIFLVFP